MAMFRPFWIRVSEEWFYVLMASCGGFIIFQCKRYAVVGLLAWFRLIFGSLKARVSVTRAGIESLTVGESGLHEVTGSRFPVRI